MERAAPLMQRWRMSLRRAEREGAGETGIPARSVTQDEAAGATAGNSEEHVDPPIRGEQTAGGRGEEAGGGMVRRHKIFHHTQTSWDRAMEELRSRGRAEAITEEEAFQRLANLAGGVEVEPEEMIGTVNAEWEGLPIGVVPW